MSITFAPAVVTLLGDELVTHALTDEGVNVNTRNGADLLALLGFEFDGDFGEVAAEDFLGRVLIARALIDTQVDDEHGLPAIQDGRFTWGGRQPGHLSMRLAELQDLAEQALADGRTVCWG